MSLVDKFAVKPLLYVVGALLLVIAAMAGIWAVTAARSSAALSVSEANASSASAAWEAARTRVGELTAANRGWEKTAGLLQTELKVAQDQLVQLKAQNAEAVAAAEAKAADADRTLSRFMDQAAAQAREPTCAQALQHVEAVCPAFEGY